MRYSHHASNNFKAGIGRPPLRERETTTMSMSKKDYVAVAAAMHRTRMASAIGATAKQVQERHRALSLACHDLAATLAHDNPAFDSARFLTACGAL